MDLGNKTKDKTKKVKSFKPSLFCRDKEFWKITENRRNKRRKIKEGMSQSHWSDTNSYMSKNSMKSVMSFRSHRSGNSHTDKEIKNNLAYQRFKKKDR